MNRQYEMLIGELSKQTGLSKDTIRFYEKLGLVVATEREAGSRLYKEFDEDTIQQLFIIRQGQSLGFTLSEMKELADVWGSSSIPKRQRLKIIGRKLEQISEKLHQLNEIQIFLKTKLSKLKTS
jgi:MerR family transcriptional regulator, copper efflux regulator